MRNWLVCGYFFKIIPSNFLFLSRWWIDKSTWIPTAITHGKTREANVGNRITIINLLQSITPAQVGCYPFHWFLLILRIPLCLAGFIILYPLMSQDSAYAQRKWRSHCSLVFWEILVPFWNLIFIYFLNPQLFVGFKNMMFNESSFFRIFTKETILCSEFYSLTWSKVCGEKEL